MKMQKAPATISDQSIELLDGLIPDLVPELRAFIKYQGQDPARFKKARELSGILASVTKAAATVTNNAAIRLAVERNGDEQKALPEPKEKKALK